MSRTIRMGFGDNPNPSREQIEFASFVVNEVGSILLFSGRQDTVELLCEAGEHALGEIVWKEIVRNAPTFQKVAMENASATTVHQPNITMSLNAKKAAEQARLSKSEVDRAVKALTK